MTFETTNLTFLPNVKNTFGCISWYTILKGNSLKSNYILTYEIGFNRTGLGQTIHDSF